METDTTPQSTNAIVSFTRTGQHVDHVPKGVSLVVIVDLGNSILLKVLVTDALALSLYAAFNNTHFTLDSNDCMCQPYHNDFMKNCNN